MTGRDEPTLNRSFLWMMAAGIVFFAAYALWEIVPALIARQAEQGVVAEQELEEEREAADIAEAIREAEEIRRRMQEKNSPDLEPSGCNRCSAPLVVIGGA